MISRQCGKTFSCCGEIVRDCINHEIEGKKTRWVILSRGERQAAEAMEETIKPFIKAFYAAYNILKNKDTPEFLEYDFKDEDSGAVYKALEVRFPSGSRITALPANPDTARGFSANVLLDEFAFHKDSRKIWGALFPVISKGEYKLRVISTPNGKGNKFYELMTGKDNIWSRHKVDIYQAVEDGLQRDVDVLREALADDDLWRQEFELEWLDEASAWLPYDLISSVEHEDAGKPELYQGGLCYVGNDIARRSDLWVVWVFEEVGDVLWTREIIEKKNIKFSEQDAILDEVMERYRVARLAMDQTGMGEKPVEDAQDRYGSLRVEGVLLNGSRPLTVATAAKQAFEDRKVRIPSGNPVLRSDLHKIKKVIGATGSPRLQADRDSEGHADRAWACFLGLAAVSGPVVEYGYQAATKNDMTPEAEDEERFWNKGAW
jgi:phage FluMu gp28-like protein